jgi:uncharacterized lipoprotein YajG
LQPPEDRNHNVHDVTIRIVTAAMAMLLLAGCDSPDTPPDTLPGAPGSATVSVHGRVETSIGGYVR